MHMPPLLSESNSCPLFTTREFWQRGQFMGMT